MNSGWQDRLTEYCAKFNIPIEYIADIISEPKVVPMIRGKGFEYSLLTRLNAILPTNEWSVTKAFHGEEAFHDTDIRVIHKRTGKPIRVECKLAKNVGYRLHSDGHSEIRVKCMRSRTLGDAMVKKLAPTLDVSETLLAAHRDQYVAADFDVVVTSIANAFYRTDRKTRVYEWKPTKAELDFLCVLGMKPQDNPKDFAFNTIYVAKTKDLIASPLTGVVCSRKKCPQKTSCGFVPNYPMIKFSRAHGGPTVVNQRSGTLYKPKTF